MYASAPGTGLHVRLNHAFKIPFVAPVVPMFSVRVTCVYSRPWDCIHMLPEGCWSNRRRKPCIQHGDWDRFGHVVCLVGWRTVRRVHIAQWELPNQSTHYAKLIARWPITLLHWYTPCGWGWITLPKVHIVQWESPNLRVSLANYLTRMSGITMECATIRPVHSSSGWGALPEVYLGFLFFIVPGVLFANFLSHLSTTVFSTVFILWQRFIPEPKHVLFLDTWMLGYSIMAFFWTHGCLATLLWPLCCRFSMCNVPFSIVRRPCVEIDLVYHRYFLCWNNDAGHCFSGENKCKKSSRMVPVSHSCKARIKDIETLAHEVLKRDFLEEGVSRKTVWK